jgi:lipopolysaccharide transport system permease protein
VIRVLGFGKTDIQPIINFLTINLRDRYLGSRLGSVWTALNPLFMFATFTLVFGYLFKVRLPGAETTLAYAIWLIGGYGPWLALSEGLLASTSSVTSASALIKNIAFKVEILPVAAGLSSIITLGTTLAFLLVMLLIDGNTPTWHVVFVVPTVAVLYLFVIALGFILATLTVFYRDIAVVLPNILTVVMFLSPILYPINALPAPLRAAAAFNPFYVLTEAFRAAVIRHETPDLLALAALGVISFVIARLGLALFRRARGQFEAFV